MRALPVLALSLAVLQQSVHASPLYGALRTPDTPHHAHFPPGSGSPLDWLTKFLSGESAAKQGDESGGWIWGWGWTWSESVITVMANKTVTFSSRPAAFGLRIVNPPGLSGHLIPTSALVPHCSASKYSCPQRCSIHPFPRLEKEGWIALIQRGECSFVEKIREAQRLGAVGVVVGGQEGPKGEELITMYSPGDATDVGIPSCYVTHESYVGLETLWEASNTTIKGYKSLEILLGEDEAWQWPVFTFSLLLLLPSILTLLTLVVHRIRVQRAEVRERAPEDIVRSLPTRVWSGSGWEKDEQATTRTPPGSEGESGEAERGEGGAEQPRRREEGWAWFETQVECAICLSAFERGDRVRVLPCGHVFHIEEVDGWLIKQKKLCPICKTDVTHPPAPSSSPLRIFPRMSATSSPPPHLLAQAAGLGLGLDGGDADGEREGRAGREVDEETPLLAAPGTGQGLGQGERS